MAVEVLTYDLDQVSVLDRVLYIVGWAEDFSPALTLDGVAVPFLSDRTARPDLVAIMQRDDVMSWGFAITALMPWRFDRTKLVLQVRPGVEIVDPGLAIHAAEDIPAIRMIDGFADTVRSTGGSLLEIGSRARSGNSYRGLFPDDIDYVGLDVTPGPNVDVVGDAHEMSGLFDRRFDYVFSVSVFEHLLMPWKVAIEMSKVMKPGALGYIQSVAAYPLHDEPWDFWRFSREAWRGLFNVHTGFEVVETQTRYPAFVVPKHIGERGHEQINFYTNHLVSACVIRRIGDAQVEWSARTADVYDLQYHHADP